MDRFERLASALRRIPGPEDRDNAPLQRPTTFRRWCPAPLWPTALPDSIFHLRRRCFPF